MITRVCYGEEEKMDINMLKINIDDEEEEEEEEDTLSFCDLPIYSNVSELKKYYSSELIQTSTAFQSSSVEEKGFFQFYNEEWSKNILSHNLHHPPQDIIFCGKLIPQKNPNIKLVSKRQISEKKCGIFGWNNYVTHFQGKSSRWYLFFFGLTKFSTEMELRDIKNRWNRRVPSSNSSLNRKCNKDKDKGIWWLIKTLSCSGKSYHAQAMVKASIHYIPQL